jgi:hypothetical protein
MKKIDINKYKIDVYPHPSGGYSWEISNKNTKETQAISYGRFFFTAKEAREDAKAEIESW